jgi:molecular chaperone HscB
MWSVSIMAGLQAAGQIRQILATVTSLHGQILPDSSLSTCRQRPRPEPHQSQLPASRQGASATMLRRWPRGAFASHARCGAAVPRAGGAAALRRLPPAALTAAAARRWLSVEPGGAADHFARFSLEPAFAIDLAALKKHYQDLQRGFHPDTLSAAGITAPHDVAAAQEESAAINDSYAVLQSPLRRAEHMLELAGDGLAEGDGVADNALLMQVMEWREDIEDAQEADDASALAGLREDFLALQSAAEEGVAAAWALPGPDLAAARAATIRLKYTRRAVEEIEGVLPAA